MYIPNSRAIIYSMLLLPLMLAMCAYAAQLARPTIDAHQETTVGQPATFKGACPDCKGTVSSWHWDFGDGKNTTTQQAKHTYSRAGKYTVTLYINGDTIQQSTLAILVKNRPEPIPESIGPTIDKTKELREALSLYTKNKNIYELAKHLNNVDLHMPIMVDGKATTLDEYIRQTKEADATIANIYFKLDSVTHVITSMDIKTK